jgi:hypothetical protein
LLGTGETLVLRRARKLKNFFIAFVFLLLLCASHARAIESLNDEWRDDTGDSATARVTSNAGGPIYTSNDHWVGPAVIVMLGLLLVAAVVGPMVRAEAVESPATLDATNDKWNE